MSASYLVLKELKVQNASAYNNFYCAGFPALTSFAGFVEALCQRLSSRLPAPLTATSFAVIVHHSQAHQGMEKHVRHMEDEWHKLADKKKLSAAIKHEPKCDMTVSVIIETAYHAKPRGFGKRGSESLYSVFAEHHDEISDTLCEMRLAGGMITNDFFDDNIIFCKKNLVSAKGIDSVEDIIRKSNPGYFMTSADELLEAHTALFDGDAMKAIAHACAVGRQVAGVDEEGNERVFHHRAQSGWVTPSNIGYVGLTKPEPMANARSDAPVVFAEPLTGLIKYTFAQRAWNKMRQEGRDQSKMFFRTRYEDNLYLVVA